ncbi:MAG: DNA-formamidopyrimidine glycosylase [Azospirillum brasilense]|nr:MAG: DNA-formamidopyrimidine glycosylase [Azospirillum brasilense]
MPELPEVETTRRGLLPSLKGQAIAELVLKRRDLRFALPDDFEARIEGRTITDIRRRAKYLLFDLDSGDVLLAHLGMSGSFRVLSPADYAPKKHDHVLFYLGNGLLCVFHDPRRFGFMTVFAAAEEAGHAFLAHLGPEPLSDAFTPEYLAGQLAKRKGPVKPALMDQKLVVGVGNIYASESLHLSGLNPCISANKSVAYAAQMVAAIRTTLEAALRSGGSTLRDYVGADGTGGYFQHHFHVYERAGHACARCNSTIETMVQAGRSTYWCPQCQPMRGKRKKR